MNPILPESPAPTSGIRREALADGRIRVHFGEETIPDVEGRPRGHVTLRLPTVDEIIDHEDPVRWLVTADSSATAVIDREALRGWLRRLIEDHDLDILGRVSNPALGLALCEAATDFFRKARSG